MRGQWATTEKRLDELEQQIQKATRLQYKTGKNLDDKLDRLSSAIKEQQEANNYHNAERIVKNLIGQIDDMDIVLGNLQEGDQWEELIKRWIDTTLSTLRELGVQDTVHLGEQFDPRLAEAIETVPTSEYLQPLQIARVYKRTFINEKGIIIRKGQVATVKEE